MNSRGTAAQILARVLADGQSLTVALDASLPQLANDQERAFVQALCYGVLRHFYRLDYQLSQLLDKPLKAKDSDIKALMLLGMYQLQYMRVKPHAAVSETVAATRHKPWSKGLVNAVLRHFQRDSDRLESQCQSNPSAQFNHPDWIIDLLTTQWPDHAEALFAANDQAAPMTLRVNRLQGSREQYQALLAEAGLLADTLALTDAGLQLHQAVPVEQLPGFSAGQVSVQDAAAQLAAGLLDLAPGQRVLDLCAAPGGKTAAILEQQPALQALMALDIDPQRLQRIASNLQRLGLQAALHCADASQIATWSDGTNFDRILLDAPCSGLGVIRRHPDIKLLRRASDIATLVALQQQILDAAWTVLAPGGLLLYATCSVLKSENEWQIAAFLERHADAECLTINADWGITRPHGRQILSGQDGMDGFYYAQLSKTA